MAGVFSRSQVAILSSSFNVWRSAGPASPSSDGVTITSGLASIRANFAQLTRFHNAAPMRGPALIPALAAVYEPPTVSITGTSMRTPTTVPRAGAELKPKRLMAATASRYLPLKDETERFRNRLRAALESVSRGT